MNVRTTFEARGDALVARVTIDNPRKLNTLDRDTLTQLAAALRDVESEPRARVVVLGSSGDRAFVGGAHLDELAALDAVTAREFITRVHDACAAARDCALPVIARIQGYCIGAGLELAAACDLRVAADTATFSMPEVRLGIPSVVEAALLPRLVGPGRARWLVLSGESIDAAEALAWGLVERVVPLGQLDSAVDAVLESILAGDDAAIRAQKRLCKLWEEAPLEASVRASVDEFARAYEGGEPARRIARLRAQRGRSKSPQ